MSIVRCQFCWVVMDATEQQLLSGGEVENNLPDAVSFGQRLGRGNRCIYAIKNFQQRGTMPGSALESLVHLFANAMDLVHDKFGQTARPREMKPHDPEMSTFERPDADRLS